MNFQNNFILLFIIKLNENYSNVYFLSIHI